jgi:hypothetical protein
MRVAYVNLVDAADLTPLNEEPLFPVTNVQELPLSERWKTTTTTAQVVIDLGSALDVSCFALAGHNATASATATLEGNATDSWGAPSFSQAVTLADTTMLFLSATQTYRYWRLTITDGTNPDGYLQVGRIFLGEYLQFPGITPGARLPRVSTAAVQRAPSGVVFGDKGIQYRAANLQFPVITEAQRGEIDTLFETVDKVDPVFMAVWESSMDYEPALYATVSQDRLDWQKDPLGRGFTLSMTITEAF